MGDDQIDKCAWCGSLFVMHLGADRWCPGGSGTMFRPAPDALTKHAAEWGRAATTADPHGLTYSPNGVLRIDPSKLSAEKLTGGKLSGDHYYRVAVAEPISPEVPPYTAECADIIEALGMTFNEGEAFKALWRLAASRQGRGKPGNQPQYDADKAAHYGARVAACVKRSG